MKSDERPSDGLTGLLPTLIARDSRFLSESDVRKELTAQLRLLALGSQGQCSFFSGLSCSWPGRARGCLPVEACSHTFVRMNFMGLLVVPSYLVWLDSKKGFWSGSRCTTVASTVRMYKLPRWQLRAGARHWIWSWKHEGRAP